MLDLVNRVPGAGLVREAVNGALDTVGSVTPQARRAAVYAGAGLLGAVGVIEWPVAAAGAAVVWLTQPRPGHRGESGGAPAPSRAATAKPAAATAKAASTRRRK
ncbi:hypothetical protein [Streptomyces orinoci]|uniref:Uncharacterized protein n=1 Tax=Streptomyces orinoci TaxID=67339 RepID=A0ABV3K768_STRON|nr:hypothetical protein [Streptomyces orinoci]